ncbi:MAG: hypothetical protein K2Y42_12555 [Hyphomicrobium sp.]|jgi:hypothetical protein|uniref:hypothetical protein n=1 Tax=Hyphomicrobium sp. TaxID=82 RepID=UPI0025BCBE7C|nr:hypothetical protein [Hyphomicrobium sp.]MBX9863570.1 hypothetical protein [Hyphomicrobium sp.]
MAVFRFLSAVFLLVATVALVVDATPASYGVGSFHATSLAGHWKELSPSSFEVARRAVVEASPWLWGNLIGPLLEVPTFVAFGALALLSGYAGRRRRTVRIFVN